MRPTAHDDAGSIPAGITNPGDDQMALTLDEALAALEAAHKALVDFRDHPFEPKRAAAFERIDAALKAAGRIPIPTRG